MHTLWAPWTLGAVLPGARIEGESHQGEADVACLSEAASSLMLDDGS